MDTQLYKALSTKEVALATVGLWFATMLNEGPGNILKGFVKSPFNTTFAMALIVSCLRQPITDLWIKTGKTPFVAAFVMASILRYDQEVDDDDD